MIQADLHNHTCHSHARDSVAAMFEAAKDKGLAWYGFSEHSARPLGYSYDPSVEYREHLAATFPDYVAAVRALRDRKPDGGPRVLLGLELDWLPAERPFLERAVRAESFDYVLGGIHYLGTWPFDAHEEDWTVLTEAACRAHYEAYFDTFAQLAASNLVRIIAHPDIIKIFSRPRFDAWLAEKDGSSLDRVRHALTALRDNGLVMEISSAGLRKSCGEIYPGPVIMRMAADLGVPVSFASDAHCTEHVAWQFDELARYAASFGYTRSHVPCGDTLHSLSFC